MSRTELARPAEARARRRARPLAPKFLAVDFFCGAGGTTRGLINAGGFVIAGIDKDERCRETFVANNTNHTLDYSAARFLPFDVFPATPDYPTGGKKDLVKDLDGLVAYYRTKARGAPLLFAICAPCQPFTKLSRKELTAKRKHGRKKDSNLLKEAIFYVRRYRPDLVLSENVAGIRDPRYGGVWDEFRADLERLGYATGSKIVCTSRFGIAQYRKRSILIAVRRVSVRSDRYADLLQSELLVPEADADAPLITAREAIGHFPAIGAGQTHPKIPNHRTRTLSDLNLKRIGAAAPGKSNNYMKATRHGDLSLQCHRKVNRRLGEPCFTDVYTRMRPDHPSPTITTKCHSISNGRFGHYDTSQLRGLSLREAAALQSFPDDYVFYPTNQIEPVARMIGNAVPPRLARFFAGYLLTAISGAGARRATR